MGPPEAVWLQRTSRWECAAMPLSDAQRARFLEELERKGIDSKKAASVKAIWPSGAKAGKPLSDTYINQVFKKGRGSYQGLKLYSDALGLDFAYIESGKRPPTAPTPLAAPPDYASLVGLIESALLLCGAKPQIAASLAETLVSTWKARQSRD